MVLPHNMPDDDTLAEQRGVDLMGIADNMIKVYEQERGFHLRDAAMRRRMLDLLVRAFIAFEATQISNMDKRQRFISAAAGSVATRLSEQAHLEAELSDALTVDRPGERADGMTPPD